MVDGSMSKPLEGLSTAFLVAMIAGAVVLGWLNSQDWLGRKSNSSGDGSSGDGSAKPPHDGLADHVGDSGGNSEHAGDDGGH